MLIYACTCLCDPPPSLVHAVLMFMLARIFVLIVCMCFFRAAPPQTINRKYGASRTLGVQVHEELASTELLHDRIWDGVQLGPSSRFQDDALNPANKVLVLQGRPQAGVLISAAVEEMPQQMVLGDDLVE